MRLQRQARRLVVSDDVLTFGHHRQRCIGDCNRLVGEQRQISDIRQTPHLPQRHATIELHAAQRIRLRQQHECGSRQTHTSQRSE